MLASDLFQLPESMPFAEFFSPDARPWEWLPKIKKALSDLKGNASEKELPSGVRIEGEVFISDGVKLPAFASIEGPCWIGEDVEIRPGAYIRGNVIIGAGSLIGNSCEYKNVLLMERTQTPHFSYVGDSILGTGAHLGAGVILSNLRFDQKNIRVNIDGERVDTGLRKFGAILGEKAEVGCNTALMPGSIIGKGSLVGPTMSFSGYLEPGQLYLERSSKEKIPLRD
ncbi:MAG: UDP-N-acetylglucosamine diphosphorylase [Verrucomicrobiota bacterium]|nr:UDP-N-acetylglucosamine diphosphorylase [Verrucomicrobiota bacterium]